MANEWIWSNSKACYDSLTPGFALSQTGVLDRGQVYAVAFTISNMTQGKLILSTLLDENNIPFEFTEDGEYTVIGTSISDNVIFVGEEYLGNVFDGCIDFVAYRSIPFYQIVDADDVVVFTQTDITQCTASGQNIQYQINWDLIGDGCYKVVIEDSGLTYESDCLTIKLDHDCTLLLDWTNNDNAYSFDYFTLEFNPKLRVEGKKWHPSYSKEKTVFKDSLGNRFLLKSETAKEELLTVREVPEYIHDALSLGLENDEFNIDGVKYTNEETEYTPSWRKSSQLAPVEVTVIKDQDLTNNNC